MKGFAVLVLACALPVAAHAERWQCNWTFDDVNKTSGYAFLEVTPNASSPDEITMNDAEKRGGLTINLKTKVVTRFDYDAAGNKVVVGRGYCRTS